jgi:hypothetical protein
MEAVAAHGLGRATAQRPVKAIAASVHGSAAADVVTTTTQRPQGI